MPPWICGQAFINAMLKSLPRAERGLSLINSTSPRAHADGYEDLKGRQYDWLYNPENMTRRQELRFKALRDSTLKTAHAWAIKEFAMSLWHYASKT
ncbi:transposase [Candidatus Vondammii sp. HM_W22]|uniref:transposase n=1 Tax=Candidatus Vondammii sp. HM_W22 TaxID=2687299 RepID=UPI002E7AB845|nr:transposase [Candidatus Vondammii sp. HM_W22]